MRQWKASQEGISGFVSDEEGIYLPEIIVDFCVFCGKKDPPVARMEIYSVSLLKRNSEGFIIGYPRRPAEDHIIIVVLSHFQCGPNTGYDIPLEDIREKGIYHWNRHLQRSKNWYDPIIFDALRLIEKINA